ncbi:MAG: Plug domain-containing protein, partial [Schleiferiaceae bacterium]|nr:Plug domain-containing protein [Schleiferiaceae bacterium]
MKQRMIISALICLITNGLNAQSQMSNGIPLPTIDVNQSLNQVMDNHAIVTLERKEIEALAANSVGDALEWMMGLDVRQRGHADVQSDLSIRGSSFDQVLILVNGVPYSDPQTGHHSMNIPVPLR